MEKRVSSWLPAGLAAGAIFLGPLSTAFAEEFPSGNKPWDWSQRNHAGIAALIEQKKGGMFDNNGHGGKGIGGGGGCGGSAGNSAAIGNYTCIIINESTAMIELLQKELGDQTANTQTATSGGDMSDVIQDLADPDP